MTPVRLEPAAPRSRVKHSTTEPLRSPFKQCGILTSVDSDEPLQPPFRPKNLKSCSVSSSSLIVQVLISVQALVLTWHNLPARKGLTAKMQSWGLLQYS